MKNLIEEIEKLRDSVKDIPSIYVEGGTDAINECLNIINQYNLITAPKEIKLSEILDRLKEEQTDYEFRYKEGSISVWKNRWCYAVLGIEDDTLKLDFDIHDRYLFPKWVFAMWIAGTIIEDDLECDE